MICVICKHSEQEIMKLQEHHARQIDENRKVSRRLDELEEKLLIESQWRKFSLMKDVKIKSDVEVIIEEKKTGLSFEEAIKYFERGFGITREGCSGIHYKKYYTDKDPNKKTFSFVDIRSNDWEIVE